MPDTGKERRWTILKHHHVRVNGTTKREWVERFVLGPDTAEVEVMPVSEHEATLAKAVEAERQRLGHGGEPDISPGDVIAAEPDGTIVLDDGITTWNPTRAATFLLAKARYAQLAKKPGVQESWKEGARREAERFLAALDSIPIEGGRRWQLS